MRPTLFRNVRPLTLCALLVVLFSAARSWAISTTVVISQVYTAGGNSGAIYNADYVELFNLSSAPVNLTGWALQYFSATASATSTPTVSPITGTVVLQPGQRYLIEATPGTVGTSTTNAADQTASNLAMGAAAGRIYVTSTTTALSNAAGCPTNYVDFVGYGTTANCYETARATAPSLSQPIARTNACADSDNNSTDFALSSTAARNSQSTLTSCAASVISSAAATPSSVTAGSSTLLTATGTVGLTVTADTSSLGGSTTQPLYDDGTHGDASPNDGTYSFTLTIPASAAATSYTLPVAATNPNTMATGTFAIALTVTLPLALTPIHTIQGATPGVSPYAGQTVSTSGIVIDVLTSGFHIQARDSADDADPHTPEGIYVYTTSGKVPAGVVVGAEVQVTGKVAVYPTTLLPGGTELDSPTGITVLTSGNALPAAVTLTPADPSPSGGIAQLAYLQSMRVAVPSLTVTEPTDGTLTEVNETYVSNGQFWGEVTGVPRPVREPGLDVRDPFTLTALSTIPRFDSDPETFELDALAAQGGTASTIDVATGAILTGVVGTMDMSTTTGPRLVIDATTRPTIVSTGIGITTVPAANAGEITIGDQNMERFYSDVADSNGSIQVTSAAFQLRLAKASLGIRNVLNTPDILCLEEMEDIYTLTQLAQKISADAIAAGQPDPNYQPFLTQGNDPSGINVAFLINPSKVDVTSVTQYGLTATFTSSTGVSTLLNDRPPLVLHAGLKRSGDADYPLTVIVNHLRSLNGITATPDTTTAATVRLKREAQAEYLANLVQGFQSAGEHVVVVGDFNAFDVNDGIVDTLGVVKGGPALSGMDVVQGTYNLVNPFLVDLAPTNLATNSYSYVFDGYAQSIDHFLSTQDIAGLLRTAPAHWNADFPVVFRNSAARPEASSDHDGIVGYLAVPAATGLPQLTTTSTLTTLAGGSFNAAITITNAGVGPANNLTLTSAILGSASATTLPVTVTSQLAAGASITFTVTFPASAGTSGSRTLERFAGTYTGGTFGGSLRVTLP